MILIGLERVLRIGRHLVLESEDGNSGAPAPYLNET